MYNAIKRIAAAVLVLTVLLTLTPAAGASAYAFGSPFTTLGKEGSLDVKGLKVKSNKLTKIYFSEYYLNETSENTREGYVLEYTVKLKNTTKGSTIHLMEYPSLTSYKDLYIEPGETVTLKLHVTTESSDRIYGVKLTKQQKKESKSRKGLKVTSDMLEKWSKKKKFPGSYPGSSIGDFYVKTGGEEFGDYITIKDKKLTFVDQTESFKGM